MDIVDDIKRDKAYIKCKFVVKNWEKDFITKHARTPSKFDIKEAPAKIKYAYKQYFHLKSAALDNTISGCDLDDEDFMQSPEIPIENFVTEAQSPDSKQLDRSFPSGEQLEQLLNPSPKAPTLPSVPKPKAKVPVSPFSNNLSKKLFEFRKFSIRNPRKSFLSQKSQKSDSSFDQTYGGTDTECSFISLDQTKHTPRVENTEEIGNIINDDSIQNNSLRTLGNSNIRNFNEAWLERATGMKLETKNYEKTSPRKSYPSSYMKGLSNLNVNQVEKCNDYVENSESDTDDTVLAKLKPALKKRKFNESITDKQSPPSRISPEPETISQLNTDVVALEVKDVPSHKTKRKRTLAKKNKTVVNDDDTDTALPPDLGEYIALGVEKNVTPRYIDMSHIIEEIKDKKHKVLSDKGPCSSIENKIKNGTLNENFVKINIEKKVFVRGKKSMNYSRYKKKLNKDKKALHQSMEFPENGKISCFKCGNTGHMARYCKAHKGDALLPMNACDNGDDDDGKFPTLEDMEKNIQKVVPITNAEELVQTLYTPTAVPDSFLRMLEQTPSSSQKNQELTPVYPEYPSTTPKELYDALKLFGHDTFRPGQEQTILRILSGMSTLLLLSTGGGKSLCYQLPAYIYSQHFKCITLVISPLVSLMEDQVLSMPEFLKAGCLHTNQPKTKRQKIIQCVKDGELSILLISPEALISGDVSSGFAGVLKSLPPIAFACIDEAHCVSQWSHNFRPSYLMICRALREKLNVKCILGLTATASQSTIKSVIEHINVPDGIQGVITNPALPDNLYLTVSFEKDKDRALVSLLSTEIMSTYRSIIVYCIRRDECERVAAILRSSLQEPGQQSMEKKTNKRKRMSYIAEAYHAGMSAAQRKKIQNFFMDGTVRIIVATVAFGMGINKADIRCIIHYNMPSSFESYVQEVGRAGRDGRPAHCHVFMSKNSNDKNELLKHIHANSIERPAIRKLLQKVFVPCQCNRSKDNSEAVSRCKGHEIGIPIDETVEELDVPSENIATLLCYLELHDKKYIKVLNNTYTVCKVTSYAGPQAMLKTAKDCAPLAMGYILEKKNNSDVEKNSILEFKVIEAAASIGWDSGMVKYQLKNLEWVSEGGRSRRSCLNVEFNTLGFRIKAPGDLSAAELDRMLDDLHSAVVAQERAKLCQLEEIHMAFSVLGNFSVDQRDITEDNGFLLEKSAELKEKINKYFSREAHVDASVALAPRPLDPERARADVRALAGAYRDCSFSGRSVARIFQGISSPNFPALVWGRCRFWRAHLHEDFHGLARLAAHEILAMRLNN